MARISMSAVDIQHDPIAAVAVAESAPVGDGPSAGFIGGS
ncbi:hypothetical protein BN903_28 [Halorubrum sp. AJ67]|nr:hypothetical protein BN903_28 [Halorubrum sp. AJ67]